MGIRALLVLATFRTSDQFAKHEFGPDSGFDNPAIYDEPHVIS